MHFVYTSPSTAIIRKLRIAGQYWPYNQLRLLQSFLRSAGKSAVIMAGVGIGFFHALRMLAEEGAAGTAMGPPNLDAVDHRLAAMELNLAKICQRTTLIEEKLEQTTSPGQLSLAIDQAFLRLEEAFDARFESQARSVEALRLMVRETDRLLERVLEGLDARAEAE